MITNRILFSPASAYEYSRR